MVQASRFAKYAVTNGGDLVVKVTISGHPGSGTSTLVNALCEHYSWSSLNGGDIFRQEAESRNLSLADFGKLCADDESVDRSLDSILQQRMLESDGPEVMESRLCGWWAYKQEIQCVRIWLEVSDTERAHRVVKREGISLDTAMEMNKKRSETDLARFQQMYSLNPSDATPYTHVIDASSLSIEEVVLTAISIMEDLV